MDYGLMRERLVKTRQWNGYNRKQFAELLNIPYRTVTNYENGSREPGSDYLIKVADVCGCTTDWLLGISDNPRNDSPLSPPKSDLHTQQLLSVCDKLNSTAVEKVIAYAEDLVWNPKNKKK